MKKRNSRLAIAIAGTLMATLSLSMIAPSSHSFADDNEILGAGSSFDYPLFTKMFSEYGTKTSTKVNYQSVGSGAGISQLTNKTVDFGATDAPMNGKQDSALTAPAIHIPVTAGAVVLSYNLPDVKGDLQLTPAVLADIFLGNITNWNDAKIAAINKGMSLPSTPVVVAHRSDGSGTTNIFTTYLAKVSEQWSSKVGKGSAVNWPVGLGSKGNEGVAGTIKQTPGAIGYIELAYAIQNSMPYARVQNKSGKFIVASTASITAAANIAIPADSKVSLTNTDAADGYPISGFSWVVLYKEQNYDSRSKVKATTLVKLVSWMIHDGQQYSNALNYAPLSPVAVKVGDALLKTVTFDGKPVL
ncbi:MAG TPA: phosphate ABC transporter substrate-binding protein PstS [Puia sp.]|jgi:phosphate transport system substrate-binding protein|nr:phosphate ABC transporter substrate-binding protein PstS [Puia sp.]